MDWQRRRLLQLIGAAGVGGLAGCNGNESEPDTDSDPSTLTSTTTPSPTTPPTPTSPDTPQPQQLSKLTVDDGSDYHFGNSVAVSSDGTTAIIGAYTADNSNGKAAGSAYVFETSGGTWTQKAILTADDGNSGDTFGSSVAMSSDGTTALIGAGGDDNHRGSAYVFETSGGAWSQQAKLTADDGNSGDTFGSSVAVSNDGTTALIGAYTAGDLNGEKAVSAYVFEASGGAWSQQTKLATDGSDSENSFGPSVAVSSDGTTVLIGAGRDDNSNGEDAGSAYVFQLSGESWIQKAKLTADDGDSEDRLGSSVAVSSDGATALIGASGDTNHNGPRGGSAYVFQASGGSWSQQTKLTADDGSGAGYFGRSVAISSDATTALIGAYGGGTAYVFEANGGAWTQKAKLTDDDGDSDDHFGWSVAVSSDGATALIGAGGDFNPEGSAYVFKL